MSTKPLPITVRVLWDLHAAYLLRCLRYLGVRESELDDAMQETFMTAHRKLQDLRTPEAPRPWLYAIALNVARHARRGRRDLVSLEAHEFADASAAGRMQARLDVMGILRALDDDKRELVVLYHLEQLTLQEIATLLECPLQTVYSRLGAATRALEAARDAAQGSV